jgi:hypothetical protein
MECITHSSQNPDQTERALTAFGSASYLDQANFYSQNPDESEQFKAHANAKFIQEFTQEFGNIIPTPPNATVSQVLEAIRTHLINTMLDAVGNLEAKNALLQQIECLERFRAWFGDIHILGKTTRLGPFMSKGTLPAPRSKEDPNSISSMVETLNGK